MEAKLILQLLHMIQAGLQWIESRGLARQSALDLLERADREGRDLTDDEVQTELDETQGALDDTRTLLEGDAP